MSFEFVGLLPDLTQMSCIKLTLAPSELRSAWASAQSDQSLLCAQWEAKDPRFLHADSELWSNWADEQADPSLRWMHVILLVLSCYGSIALHKPVSKLLAALSQSTTCFMTKPTQWRAPSEDSDQRGHLPSLIRVFAVRMKKAWVLSYPLSAQQRLWSDWANAQADLSLCWVHCHYVGFIMRRLILDWEELPHTHETVIKPKLLLLKMD